MAERKWAADERQQMWEELSPQQQLVDLDRRLGEDQGARKQRVRLALKVKKAQEKKGKK